MEVALSTLAAELSTTERTLRRAVAQGLLRAERPSPRKLVMPVAEREFLRRAWGLLSRLRQALRTEPTVALAVIFGSASRGEMHPGSDVDILVSLRESIDGRALASRLTDRLGVRVQVVSLADAEHAPLVLAEVLRDGRVLIDRDDLWVSLLQRRSTIERAAAEERERIDREFSRLFRG